MRAAAASRSRPERNSRRGSFGFHFVSGLASFFGQKIIAKNGRAFGAGLRGTYQTPDKIPAGRGGPRIRSPLVPDPRALEGARKPAEKLFVARERATVRRAYVGPSRKGAAVADVWIPATRLLRILTSAAVDVDDGPSRRARRGRRRRTARGAAPPRASPLLVVGPAVRRPAMDSSGVAAVRTARREFGPALEKDANRELRREAIPNEAATGTWGGEPA